MKREAGRREGVKVTIAAQVEAYTQKRRRAQRKPRRRRTKRDKTFPGSSEEMKQMLPSYSAVGRGREV